MYWSLQGAAASQGVVGSGAAAESFQGIDGGGAGQARATAAAVARLAPATRSATSVHAGEAL